jgi:hypothetical protein
MHNSVRTAIFITVTNWLTPFKQIIIVYADDYTRPRNTKYTIIVKAGDNFKPDLKEVGFECVD